MTSRDRARTEICTHVGTASRVRAMTRGGAMTCRAHVGVMLAPAKSRADMTMTSLAVRGVR